MYKISGDFLSKKRKKIYSIVSNQLYINKIIKRLQSNNIYDIFATGCHREYQDTYYYSERHNVIYIFKTIA